MRHGHKSSPYLARNLCFITIILSERYKQKLENSSYQEYGKHTLGRSNTHNKIGHKFIPVYHNLKLKHKKLFYKRKLQNSPCTNKIVGDGSGCLEHAMLVLSFQLFQTFKCAFSNFYIYIASSFYTADKS